ncbi:MAG TPA: hypothetical protein VGR50_02315 [Terriglobales bacterium]|nr:hypothetical protein [Terriglobales bacterium]
MHVEFSIELGAQDEALELPWSSPSGELRYYDLKRQPELLLEVSEAFENQELGEFLAATNSANSICETSKCDTWLSDQIEEEERVFGAAWKFGAYVDLVFSQSEPRHSLPAHEQLARSLCELLKRAPDISCAAEFCIRHCHYHEPGAGDSKQGFAISFYMFGYGDDEAEARSRWNIGMKLVENALLQLSAQQRRSQLIYSAG